MESYRKLYRSTDNKVIAGVAGGLASYLGASPTLIRILFMILFVAGGGGGFLYLLLWALTPRRPSLVIDFDGDSYDDEPAESNIGRILKASLCAMILMITGWIFSDDIWVTAFAIGVGIGLYWFWKSSDGRSGSVGSRAGLHRSVVNKKVCGVFGGLAETIGVDATILRVIGVVLLFAGVGMIVPVYFIYTLLVPKGAPQEQVVERVVIV